MSSNDSLSIDKNGLDEELLRQVELFSRASEEVAALVSIRDQKKLDLDTARAEAYLNIRDDMSRSKDKFTEALLTAQVEIDSNYHKAQKSFLKAKAAAIAAENRKEAVAQRGYVLKDLCGLYVSGYYSTASVSGSKSNDIRTQEYEENRRRMAKQRRAKLE
jgi:hypothetical protein